MCDHFKPLVLFIGVLWQIVARVVLPVSLLGPRLCPVPVATGLCWKATSGLRLVCFRERNNGVLLSSNSNGRV